VEGTARLLDAALSCAREGGTALVVAGDEERLAELQRRLFETVRAGAAEPAAWDDRTVPVGEGVVGFFTAETIRFVLEQGHWYGARVRSAPEVLWDGNARALAERAPDGPVDLSHLHFGRKAVDIPARPRTAKGHVGAGPAASRAPADDRPAGRFLSTLMRRLRRGRLRLTRDLVYYNGIHEYADGVHVSTWFQTRGCTWDLQRGGCTMCNYARGLALSAEEMLAAVEKAFAETRGLDVESRFVYPAGSLFDPAEVPAEARRGIWRLLRASGARRAKTQARPEHVTPELTDEFVAALPGKRLALHLGLESACEWVVRFCVNRGSGPEEFAKAARLSRGRGVRVRANVILGAPFLAEGEALEDAVMSARWAFENGADEVAFQPVHAKPNTLLAALYSLGRHRPASLWSLVEALRRVDEASWPALRFFGWVPSYPDRRKIVASPTTCPICRGRVLPLLGECHRTWSREPLEELVAMECRCKERWREEVTRAPEKPLADRVLEAYALLAREHGLADRWERDSAEVEVELRATLPAVERALRAV
jgi:hypothetical protein